MSDVQVLSGAVHFTKAEPVVEQLYANVSADYCSLCAILL